MDLEAILNLLKDYDLPTIIAGIIVYIHINRKLNTVSEIHRKVDLNAITTSRNIEYIKREIDAHRDIDEKTFVDLAKDIKKIHKKLNNIGTI